jgi:hypothetical protein
MTHQIQHAPPPVSRPELRFGDKSHPILKELQARVDALPKESLNFVAALMSDDTIVGPPLSDLVFGMIYIRNGISIEPIHQALTAIVASRKDRDAAQAQMRNEKMTFITACRAEKAADGALKFLVELQTLMEFAK